MREAPGTNDLAGTTAHVTDDVSEHDLNPTRPRTERSRCREMLARTGKLASAPLCGELADERGQATLNVQATALPVPFVRA